MRELIRKVLATRERLTVDGKPPTLSELAGACHIDVPKVVECLSSPRVSCRSTLHWATTSSRWGTSSTRSPPSPSTSRCRAFIPKTWSRVLGALKEREADVLRMRFGLRPYEEPHTLDEIGKRYGVTRERIRQIESKAMGELFVPRWRVRATKCLHPASPPDHVMSVPSAAREETCNVQAEPERVSPGGALSAKMSTLARKDTQPELWLRRASCTAEDSATESR